MEKFEYIAIALLVITLGVGAYAVKNADSLLPSVQVAEPAVETTTYGDAIRMGTAPRPAPTPAQTTKALANTTGFQALVSYTDRGFEPRIARIKAGETVRFTNNSSGNLQLYISGSTESALAPQEFREVAFDTKGDKAYLNSLDETKSGVVKVE